MVPSAPETVNVAEKTVWPAPTVVDWVVGDEVSSESSSGVIV